MNVIAIADIKAARRRDAAQADDEQRRSELTAALNSIDRMRRPDWLNSLPSWLVDFEPDSAA